MSQMVGGKVEVGVKFDMVEIIVHCGDEYKAQVLYDDIVDRLRDGEGIQLSLGQDGRPKPRS